MGDMKIEDKIGTKDSNGHCAYTKEKFAKAMNCSISLLDNLDRLTNNIGKVIKIDSYNNLIGNIGCKTCGRWYLNKNRLWIGVFFDRPHGYKLSVGFCVNPKKPEAKSYISISRLLKTHYNYYAEYIDSEKDYWFYVFLNNKLEPSCNTFSTFNEIEKILKEVKVI